MKLIWTIIEMMKLNLNNERLIMKVADKIKFFEKSSKIGNNSNLQDSSSINNQKTISKTRHTIILFNKMAKNYYQK